MKNINLSLIALTFSSLLMGCGMKGPLYRETPPKQEQVVTKKITDTLEQNSVTETEESTQ
jgi:predicted small lipoprotein YifL